MDGKGNSVGPDLTAREVQNQTDGALFWKIAQGKPPMPRFQDTLTAHQGWDLVNYVRTLASQSAPAPEGATTGRQTAPAMQPGMGRGMMGSGMMQGGMGRGMMGPGMMQGGMGRRMMMQQDAGPMGSAGCPACGAAWNALSRESVTATSDGGVVVLIAGKLIKYDGALKKVAETDIDVDWAQVHRKIQQIMQDCPMAQDNQSGPPASQAGVEAANQQHPPGQP
jgi:hypothetical protein